MVTNALLLRVSCSRTSSSTSWAMMGLRSTLTSPVHTMLSSSSHLLAGQQQEQQWTHSKD
jgi:hypothetical protein